MYAAACARGHVSAATFVHEATCQLLHLFTRPRVFCYICARVHVSAAVHDDSHVLQHMYCSTYTFFQLFCGATCATYVCL